ncbi:MAG TPA: alpha/beta hydrolase [Dehalococcoidia bacterium]|nr:alpha/beta hydrolase [Dehalococcoidia bacterium]
MQLHSWESGPAHGPPVVFLPGLGGDGRWWRPVASRLDDRYRCFCLDLRDSGRSARSPAPYTVADMAEDVAAFCQAQGLSSVYLVGYSLGGAVAQELAIGRPELVRRLVLVATYTSGDPRGAAIFKGFAALRRSLPREEYLRLLFPWVYSHQEYRQPGLVEEAVARAAADPLWPEDDAYQRQVEAALSFCSEGRLAGVTCPVLLVFGDQDIMTPLRFAHRLQQELPLARLVVLAGTGHGLLFTRWREVASLVRGFLDEDL